MAAWTGSSFAVAGDQVQAPAGVVVSAGGWEAGEEWEGVACAVGCWANVSAEGWEAEEEC